MTADKRKVKGDFSDISALERQIDKLVYDLYGLTPKEIEIVEGKGGVISDSK
jgi:hypothetical protein